MLIISSVICVVKLDIREINVQIILNIIVKSRRDIVLIVKVLLMTRNFAGERQLPKYLKMPDTTIQAVMMRMTTIVSYSK